MNKKTYRKLRERFVQLFGEFSKGKFRRYKKEFLKFRRYGL